MNRKYDLVVIGAGTATIGVASRVRTVGWTAAVADFRPFGGNCALRDCDPKKLLISGTSAIDQVTRMYGNGVAGNVCIEWSELMALSALLLTCQVNRKQCQRRNQSQHKQSVSLLP